MALCLAEGKPSFPVLTIKTKTCPGSFLEWRYKKHYDTRSDRDLFYLPLKVGKALHMLLRSYRYLFRVIVASVDDNRKYLEAVVILLTRSYLALL